MQAPTCPALGYLLPPHHFSSSLWGGLRGRVSSRQDHSWGTLPIPHMYILVPQKQQQICLKPLRDAGERRRIYQVLIPSKGGHTRQNLQETGDILVLPMVPPTGVLWHIPAASLWLRSGGTAGSQSPWQRWLWFLRPHEPKLPANLRAQRETNVGHKPLGYLGATSCCRFSFKFKKTGN